MPTGAIVKGYFEEFDPEIRDMSESIVNAAIETYQFMTVQVKSHLSESHLILAKLKQSII